MLCSLLSCCIAEVCAYWYTLIASVLSDLFVPVNMRLRSCSSVMEVCGAKSVEFMWHILL